MVRLIAGLALGSTLACHRLRDFAVCLAPAPKIPSNASRASLHTCPPAGLGDRIVLLCIRCGRRGSAAWRSRHSCRGRTVARGLAARPGHATQDGQTDRDHDDCANCTEAPLRYRGSLLTCLLLRCEARRSTVRTGLRIRRDLARAHAARSQRRCAGSRRRFAGSLGLAVWTALTPSVHLLLARGTPEHFD
jgi:hypothetical protein